MTAVHHIGSTAVPGLRAKPVVDMLAEVADLACLDGQNDRLEALGYEVMGEFGMSGRRYFRKNNPEGGRTHQLHVFEAGSPQVRRHLDFRDFLRAHPEHALAYAHLKSELAERFPWDISAYTDGKDLFIRDMDARASAWRAGGGA